MKRKHILSMLAILVSGAPLYASVKCPTDLQPFADVKDSGMNSSIIDHIETVGKLHYHWISTPFQASSEFITGIISQDSEVSSGLTCSYKIKQRLQKDISTTLSLVEFAKFDPGITTPNIAAFIHTKTTPQKIGDLVWTVKSIENPSNIYRITGSEYRNDVTFTKVTNGLGINTSYRFYNAEGQSGLIFLEALFTPGKE